MGFLKLFLRGIALLPSLIQGIEGMFGDKAGAEKKKKAALEIVGAAINVADAIEGRQIADSEGFTDGLGKIIDGVVECLNASVWHKT
jgi:hypothetical protein